MSAFPTVDEKARETEALEAVSAAIAQLGAALSKTRHQGAITALGRALTEARCAEAMLEECKERWL